MHLAFRRILLFGGISNSPYWGRTFLTISK